jgi:hypothetical protein
VSYFNLMMEAEQISEIFLTIHEMIKNVRYVKNTLSSYATSGTHIHIMLLHSLQPKQHCSTVRTAEMTGIPAIVYNTESPGFLQQASIFLVRPFCRLSNKMNLSPVCLWTETANGIFRTGILYLVCRQLVYI